MDEAKNGEILFVVIIGLSIICIAWCVCEIVLKIFEDSYIKDYGKAIKSEYKKYKDYLLNNKTLCLDKPRHLKLPFYSDSFTNNSELRRTFMQVGYTFRELNALEEKKPDIEIEKIFSEVRQAAYSNNEPTEKEKVFP